MSIATILQASAERFPDRVALTGENFSWTYAALADRVARLAAGFVEQGLVPGDRLALLLRTSDDLVSALFAATWAELIAVPITPWYAPPQIEYILRHSGARCLVSSTALLERVPAQARAGLEMVVSADGGEGCLRLNALHLRQSIQPVRTMPDPIGLLIYTSGTTSRPKGVAHTQGRMAHRVDLLVEEMAFTQDDSTLQAVDISRPVGLLGQLLPMLRVGGRVHLPPPHAGPPDLRLLWSQYGSLRPSYMLTSPATALDLLAHQDASRVDHARLRFWIVGGDRAPAALYRGMAQIVSRPLLEMCGMTETGFYTINPHAGPVKVGSIGLAMRGVAVRLVSDDGDDVRSGQVGRLLVRTPDMMVGYWNDTLMTHRAVHQGWLDTGDLARADEDGYLWFVGRVKEMINRGGWKVAPAMVEEALQEHPALERATVVGLPDAREGQVPFAFYRVRDGAADPGEEELRRWAACRLDPASVPVAFARIEDWPLTTQGKLDRARLVWMAEAGDRKL